MDRSKLANAGPARKNQGKKWVRPTVSTIVAGSAELGGDTLPEGVPITS